MISNQLAQNEITDTSFGVNKINVEWNDLVTKYQSTLYDSGREISLFSKVEIDYLKSQRLARIATVSKKGQPDVVPIGFQFDGTYFWVGSHDQKTFHTTIKYHNVKNGNKLVSLVIDDLKSINPWKPRSIKVYGIAEVMEHSGMFGHGDYLRITPRISWSMGLEGLDLQERQWRLKTVHSI